MVTNCKGAKGAIHRIAPQLHPTRWSGRNRAMPCTPLRGVSTADCTVPARPIPLVFPPLPRGPRHG